jgi:hypothetical protein
MNKRVSLAESDINGILRSLLDIKIPEHLRNINMRNILNINMRNILKLDCILEDIKCCQQNWRAHLKQAEGKPLSKVTLQHKPRKSRDVGKPTKRCKDLERFVV